MILSPQLEGAVWTAGVTLLVALLGWIGNVLVKRTRTRASEPDLWKRLDELSLEIYGDSKEPGLKKRLAAAETQNQALGRIVRDLAQSWKGPPPRLNPQDLAQLDYTILPAEHWWRRKPPPLKESSVSE
jgi:hypothetical protein